ncbi:TolC family protein [Ornithobacterium rhinotracheale]
MKKLLILMCATASVWLGAQQQKTLTLKEAINYALENKSEAEKAALEIEKSEYKIKEVRANALPNVSVSGGLTYNPLLQEVIFPSFTNPNENMKISLGQPWNSNVNATLTQVLFNQSVFTGLKAARSTKEFYMLNKELTDEQIIEKVAHAYFQVYQTQQKLNNLESNLALTEKTVKVIQGQFEAGLARKIDLDRANVTLNNLKSSQQQLVNAVQIAQNALKFMVGLLMDTQIQLPEDTFAPSILALNEQADLSKRTEVQVIEKQLELLEWQKKANQAEYYPSAALVANYGWLGQGKKMPWWHGEEDKVYWSDLASIGLNVKIPIFNGFSIKSKVKQSEIDILSAKAGLKDTKLALEMAYKNATEQMKNTAISIDVQQENVKLAENVLTNTQNNYQYGLATLTDLLDSERALADAKNNLTNAKLDYKLAEIEYLKAQGNLKSLIK